MDCWICFEGSDDLIRPCLCRGALSNVHESCLIKWCSHAPEPYNEQCRFCNWVYRMAYDRPFELEAISNIRYVVLEAPSAFLGSFFYMGFLSSMLIITASIAFGNVHTCASAQVIMQLFGVPMAMYSYGRKTRILTLPQSLRRYICDVYSSVQGLGVGLYPLYWWAAFGYLLSMNTVDQVICYMFFMLPLHYLYGAWVLICHARVIHNMNQTLKRVILPLSKRTRRKMHQRLRKRICMSSK